MPLPFETKFCEVDESREHIMLVRFNRPKALNSMPVRILDRVLPSFPRRGASRLAPPLRALAPLAEPANQALVPAPPADRHAR